MTTTVNHSYHRGARPRTRFRVNGEVAAGARYGLSSIAPMYHRQGGEFAA